MITSPKQEAAAVQTRVRWGVLAAGAVLAAATAALVTWAEMVLSSVRIGYLQFPPAALGLFLVVIAANRAVRRLTRRHGITPSELLVLYAMMLVAALVASHGIVEKWIPLLVAPKYYADTTNNWHELYDPNLPRRLVPYDPRNGNPQGVATWYHEGLPRGGHVPWGAWAVPIANWAVLIALIVFAFLCLASILRKQWVENERLAFPLAQLPLEMASDDDAFFRSRTMWLGALIPVVVFTLKGLHRIYPVVPDVAVTMTLTDFATTPPWNQLLYTPFLVSFAAVGFFCLLPVDVLFSIWFFFVMTRLAQAAAIAYDIPIPGMPLMDPPLFVSYQSIGANIVLVVYFFLLARPHLQRVWNAAIGKEKVDDSKELLPYRIAVWGLFGSVLASAVWLWAAGMSLWLALLELGVFLFIIAIVMARSTAEAGMLMTETTFRPIDVYRMFGSIHDLGPQNLTLLAFFDNIALRDQRGLVFTGMLDSLRISDGTRLRRGAFFGPLVLAVAVSAAVGIALNIYLPYTLSAGKMDPWMEVYSPQGTWRDYAQYFAPGRVLEPAANWQMPVFFVFGCLMTIFLTVMRAKYYWWPFHPLGYAIAGSWSTIQFWFPCLIAWIVKGLLVRYGGIKAYRAARPLFLGLVLGEFGMAVLSTVLSFFHIPWPNYPWG